MKTNRNAILIVFLLTLVINIQVIAQTKQPIPSSTLWQLSMDGTTNLSYILLTTTTCSDIKLSDKAKSKLQEVESILVESNLNSKQNSKSLLSLVGIKSDDQRIKNILPNTPYHQLIYACKEYGLSEQFLNQFKPFYIYSLVMQNANPCPPSGSVENELQEYAKKNGKNYEEIFSPENVIADFDGYSKEYWRQLISYSITNNNTIKQSLQVKNDYYDKENLEGLSHLLSTDPYFKLKYAPHLGDQRSKLIFEAIEKATKNHKVLITTDILWSLQGEQNSVFQLLKTAGYKLTPVL